MDWQEQKRLTPEVWQVKAAAKEIWMANLSRTNLRGAELFGSNLGRRDLRGKDLRPASTPGASGTAPSDAAMRMLLQRYRKWLLLVTLGPLIASALFVTLAFSQSWQRYRAGYFTEPYLQQYASPGAVVTALEHALRRGEFAVQAELQGMRRPRDFGASAQMEMAVRLQSDSSYEAYLFYDSARKTRHVFYVHAVRGRWVLAPEDAYFYLNSGRWLRVALPLALSWWLLELAAVLAGWGWGLGIKLRSTR
jgi:hypothetical protein